MHSQLLTNSRSPPPPATPVIMVRHGNRNGNQRKDFSRCPRTAGREKAHLRGKLRSENYNNGRQEPASRPAQAAGRCAEMTRHGAFTAWTWTDGYYCGSPGSGFMGER